MDVNLKSLVGKLNDTCRRSLEEAAGLCLSRTNYNDAFLYHLFPDLVPGTRYIEMDPGIANEPGSGLVGELERNDWLILSDSADRWTEPNDSAHAGDPELNRVVEELYCPVLDAGGFTLLRRCRDA